MARLTTAVLVLALGFVVAVEVGCAKCSKDLAERVAEEATERIVENRTGENVEVDAGGTVDIADLPEFLRYPGMTATGKFSLSSSEGKGTVWSLESKDPLAKVGDWYRKSLEAQGWTKGAEMETGESLMLMWTTADEKETISVMLLTEDGKTTVSLTHAIK
jgi:hypothetical protein